MDRDDFVEALREQYADEIHEAYIECEHENGKNIDFEKLNDSLAKLMKAANVDGLHDSDFKELVKSTLPEVVEHVPFLKAA